MSRVPAYPERISHFFQSLPALESFVQQRLFLSCEFLDLRANPLDPFFRLLMARRRIGQLSLRRPSLSDRKSTRLNSSH